MVDLVLHIAGWFVAGGCIVLLGGTFAAGFCVPDEREEDDE